MAWDDGSAFDPNDSSQWTRCCTFFKRGQNEYKIWSTKGKEECLPHEECHIEIFEDDGFVVVPENHKACHRFGFGKPRNRMTP